MNASPPTDPLPLDDYALDDRYGRTQGRVMLSGTQALVRIALAQAARDRAAGLNTAGLISGYRGSPLGGFDKELWRAGRLLADARIDFVPAVNEELAATALMGSQQVETDPDRTVDAVFGLWYGKGPGVDRAGDALKHGNAFGSSPRGGVLVVAGDDHGCVSSSMGHQSDATFLSFFMPVLNPGSVGEYLPFGEYGFALSRFSGTWVGFKAISETVESTASVELAPQRTFARPDFIMPPGGLHYRWPDRPGPHIEELLEAKKHAVLTFAEANPLDRALYADAHATYGIVTTGKGHYDLMEALRLLGLDEAECRRLGIDVYKVGMVWPLARKSTLDFVRGKHEVLVVEEKRGIIESQLKEYFYDTPGAKPRCMVGKHDESGARLLPWTGELSPVQLAGVLAARLDRAFEGLNLTARAGALTARIAPPIDVPGPVRTPYFCSGCPHNTSTKVPAGSKGLGGIGCHVMAEWMDRSTESLVQMGGEGVNWAARSRFNGRRHAFQNLGDGTYYHSGSLAIRQSIAMGANITYKILFNDAVAMTGGQPVDGPISVPAIAAAVRAEGVARIAVVSDAPETLSAADFPAGTTFHHRDGLDALQREMRTVQGVSVLIYQQLCATEKRRRRKRGKIAPAARHVFINPLVCEGCGDCSTESNCLSVEPLETPFGRKRTINQSSCNTDYSCLKGFCPSFVTVEGSTPRKGGGAGADAALIARAGALPAATPKPLDGPYDLLVAGVGGTGVVTVGALIAMAAHLEGKGASVLDFTGFAQKFGPVIGYVRLAPTPAGVNQTRIEQGRADAVIGCDLVVAVSPKATRTVAVGRTRVVLNSAEMPTGDFTRERDATLNAPARIGALRALAGAANFQDLDANRLSETLFGATTYANVIMLGAAWQAGLVPIGLAALERAIDLNGVEPARNKAAVAAGRLAVAEPGFGGPTATPAPDTLDDIVAVRRAFLADYQDDRYAARFTALVERVRAAEAPLGGEPVLTKAVARAAFHVMAYKDEYEVARLHTQTGFVAGLRARFDGPIRVVHHFAPPVLGAELDARGRPRKRTFGPWVVPALKALARMKRLRGTPFDPFGHTAERRRERERIVWYFDVVDRLLATLGAETRADCAAIAAMPLAIRGYGPVKDEAAATVRAAVEEKLG